MRKKILGRTGLEVTELGYGTGQLRGPRHWNGRPISPEQANQILNAVLDNGINFIDTANLYGQSEDYIGQFISARRGEYYLATKCGCQIIPGAERDDHRRLWDPAFLMESVNASLTRSKTDYLDLLQLHNPTLSDVEQHDLPRFLEDVRRDGKARFVGVSTTLPDLPKFIDMGIFDTFQIPYSALEREHEDLIRQVAASGSGVIVRGGVAQGAPDKNQGSARDLWQLAKLDELCQGLSRMEFILRFTLSHEAMHTAIVATLMPEHLAENVRAAKNGPLPHDVYIEAQRRLDNVKVHSPE